MQKLLILLTILLSFNLQAEDEKQGLAIALEVEKRDSGWGDFSAEMQMILINRKGEKTTRKIKNFSLEVDGDGDKSMSLFETPRDVKGTAMLTFSHKLDADEQWLYLPALKRVKRISSRNKSGPFMGSEFAYEDISSQEVEKYKHFYLSDETLDGVEVFKTKRIPQYKYSGYTKQITYIEKERYIPLKIEYYDRKNSLLKTLIFQDYKQYLDKFWRASIMQMTNHQNGKQTTLNWQNYKFQTGLKDSDFKSSKLKRLR
jgi:outer membrane lipoprotein-sorting protein